MANNLVNIADNFGDEIPQVEVTRVRGVIIISSEKLEKYVNLVREVCEKHGLGNNADYQD